MSLKKNIASLGVALALTFGAASNTSAVTLEEYDSVDQDTQNRVVAAVLRAYYNQYSSDAQTSFKAQCMADLYKPADDGSGKPLIRHIINDIDTARSDKSRHYTIEGIVENIIDRECQTNIAGTPQPPNGPG